MDIRFPPERVVSLDPGATETIFLLGLGGSLIATDAFSYRPQEARKVRKIGSYTHVDTDFLLREKPDLILTSVGAQKDLARTLHGIGLSVYPLQVPTSISGILDNILIVSLVMGAGERGRRIYNNFMSSLECKEGATRVYVEFDLGGPITIGYPTHVSDALYCVGSVNVFDSQPEAYFTPSPDMINQARPEVFILEPKRDTEWERERMVSSLRSRGVTIPDRVYFTRGDFLAHLGPSFITEGMRWLRGVLLPPQY